MNQNFQKIKTLLDASQKRQLLLLLFFLFVGMLFEILGIGVLLPVLKFLLEPEKLKVFIQENALTFLEEFDYNTIIFFSLSLIVCIYLFRTVYLVYVNYKQNFLIERIHAYLVLKLYKKYIYQSFLEHQYRDISDMLKNIQIEVIYFRTYLNALVLLIVEVSLVASIFFTIVVIEPKGAFTLVLVFGFLSIIYFQFAKKRVKRWGKSRQIIDARISKKLVDSLTGIKELKLHNSESFFVEQIDSSLQHKSIIGTKQLTLSQLPRFYLESITVVGLVILIVVLFSLGHQSSSIIATLGVFVAAAFRVIPSINRILNALQNLKFHGASVDKIYAEVMSEVTPVSITPSSNDRIDFQQKISIDNLCFSYGASEILKDVSLTIKKGETVGIVGESGSGKSTLADLLSGLLEPTSGQIIVDDIPINQNPRAWKNQLGYVGQEIFLMDHSILANVAFGVEHEAIDMDRVYEVLESAQLRSLIEKSADGIHTYVGERGIQLSGGQRQRIGIARALYHNPNILIFDESTAALDTQTEREVMKSIYKLNKDKTIIIIAHRTSTLEKCDKIYEIENGKIKEKIMEWETTK